jgi:GR25 family glycosyltransferase involved in LPS biosynthesis
MERIDHIFYINLDKRGDRRTEIEDELSRMNLTAERFSAIAVDPPMGILGCGKSHLQVYKIAKERGYKNVLILEDDFVFTVDRQTLDENINKLLNEQPDFDVCFLAYYLERGEQVSDKPFLIRDYHSTTASAYIVNSHYYDILIHLYEWAMPLLESTQEHWNYANDQVWARLQNQDKWYCFSTRMGVQRDGFSDNTQTFVSRGV